MLTKRKVYNRLKRHINRIRFYSIYEAYNKGYITIRQRDKLLDTRTKYKKYTHKKNKYT